MAQKSKSKSKSKSKAHSTITSPTPSRPLNFLPELLLKIFDYVQSSSETRTSPLAQCALVCKDWYRIAFSLIHRDLLLTRTLKLRTWTPKSVDQLSHVLLHSPAISKSIETFQLPRLVDDMNWIFQQLAEEDLQPFFDRAMDEAEARGEETNFDLLTPEQVDDIMISACVLQQEARYDITLDRLIMMEGSHWILEQKLAEKAFFELIRYLPCLKVVHLEGFKSRVRHCSEDSVMRKVAFGMGGRSSGGRNLVGEMDPPTFSKVEKLYTVDCGPKFEASIKHHWRFTDI